MGLAGFSACSSAPDTVAEDSLEKRHERALKSLGCGVPEHLDWVLENPLNPKLSQLSAEEINSTSSGVSLLFAASKLGLDSAVKSLIELGADPDLKMSAPGCAGWTALMIASAEHQVSVVRALLELKANPNATNGSGRTAMHYAATYGDTEVVSELIKAKADYNIRQTAGGPPTPLMAASFQSKVRTAMYLIASGARPDMKLDCAGYPDASRACYFVGHVMVATKKPELILQGLSFMKKGCDQSASVDGNAVQKHGSCSNYLQWICAEYKADCRTI